MTPEKRAKSVAPRALSSHVDDVSVRCDRVTDANRNWWVELSDEFAVFVQRCYRAACDGFGVHRVLAWNKEPALVFHLVILLLVATACGKTPPVLQPTIVEVVKTVEIKVPIPVKAEPPPELLAPFKIPLPVFVAPSDAETSSALTVDGERLLRGLVEELLQRLKAWEEWAKAK